MAITLHKQSLGRRLRFIRRAENVESSGFAGRGSCQGLTHGGGNSVSQGFLFFGSVKMHIKGAAPVIKQRRTIDHTGQVIDDDFGVTVHDLKRGLIEFRMRILAAGVGALDVIRNGRGGAPNQFCSSLFENGDFFFEVLLVILKRNRIRTKGIR
jgi:hypothetical protein